MTRRFLLAGLVLPALLLAPARAFAASGPTVTVPLELLKTRHLAVKVKLNDQGPFRLVLDTGSPVTFISGRAAKAIGLLDAKRAQGSLMGMYGQAKIAVLDVGGAQVRDVGVLLFDHPVLQILDQVDGPIDGIVGYTFFGRFRTTLDYAAGQATFQPVDYVPTDVVQGLTMRMFGGPPRRVLAPTGLWGMRVAPGPGGKGVRVAQVFPGSAAAAAGLLPGDELLTLDDRWTETVLDCYQNAAVVPAGTPVSVRVRRAGKELALTVRPRAGL